MAEIKLRNFFSEIATLSKREYEDKIKEFVKSNKSPFLYFFADLTFKQGKEFIDIYLGGEESADELMKSILENNLKEGVILNAPTDEIFISKLLDQFLYLQGQLRGDDYIKIITTISDNTGSIEIKDYMDYLLSLTKNQIKEFTQKYAEHKEKKGETPLFFLSLIREKAKIEKEKAAEKAKKLFGRKVPARVPASEEEKWKAFMKNLEERGKEAEKYIKLTQERKVVPKVERRIEVGGYQAPYELQKFADYCTFEYIARPWIENYKQIWIIPLNPEANAYVRVNETTAFDGQSWFKPKGKYTTLICSKKEKRNQSGQVHTIVDDNNVSLQFKVGYELKDGSFIIQDESIFNKEQAWLKESSLSFEDKINILLDSKLTDIVTSELRAIMKFYLNLLEDYVKDVSEGAVKNLDVAKFVNEVENAIYSKSIKVKDYIYKIADFIVYVDPVYYGAYGDLFKLHLLAGYYEGNIIMDLNEDEKLPEIFQNNLSIEIKDKIRKNIKDITVSLTNYYASLYIKLTSPSIKKNVPITPVLDLDFTPLYALSKNFDPKYLNLPFDVIYYKDEDNLYIFSIHELLKDKQTVNPFTTKRFNNEFMKELSHFSTSGVSKAITIALFGESLEDLEMEEKEGELAPGFIDVLRAEIARLNKGKFSFGEGEEEKESEESEEEKEGEDKEEEKEDKEEEKEDKEEEEGEGEEIEEIKKEIKRLKKEKKLLKKVDKCYKCKKACKNNFVTIIKEKNKGQKRLSFCSMKCFKKLKYN